MSNWAQGYVDAVGWLPSATRDEIAEIMAAGETGKRVVSIYADHTLAVYWASVPSIRPVAAGDVPVGDVDPWDNGYGSGFVRALRERAGAGR